MNKLNKHQQEDVISVWDKVATTYNEIDIMGADYRAYLQVILECTGNPMGRTFCEVGCGSGTTSALLAHMGAIVTLVDLSPKALEFAQKHFESLNLKANYYRQDALKMDFTDESFDVVWNGGVVEHFEDDGKIKLISDMRRILKPGGILLIKAPNKWDIPFTLFKIWAEWRKTWPFGYEDDLTIRRFTSLAKQAGVSNFKIFAYNPIVGWWFGKYGKQVTEKLGLNTTYWHAKKLGSGTRPVSVIKILKINL